MLKLFTILVVVVTNLLTTKVCSQLEAPKLKYTSNVKKITKDSILQRLRADNKVTILFYKSNPWHPEINKFTVIAYGEDSTLRMYSLIGHNQFADFKPLYLSKDSIRKVWKAFVENGIFTLKDEKDLHIQCEAIIFDSYKYEIRIITKKQYKTLNYFDPEFYENNCNTVPERIKIINWASEISQVLN